MQEQTVSEGHHLLPCAVTTDDAQIVLLGFDSHFQSLNTASHTLMLCVCVSVSCRNVMSHKDYQTKLHDDSSEISFDLDDDDWSGFH